MRYVTSWTPLVRYRRPWLRRWCSILALSLLAGLLAGCSHDGHAADARPHRGGTIYLLTEANGFSHLDPQRNYTTAALNVGRLIYRTLTAFRPVAGHPDGVLTPDLATGLGRASHDNRTWTFTLRAGTAWADGRPVTCRQVRYGVERSFSAPVTGGPDYPRQLLAGAAGYHGPDHGADLASVSCLSPRTIRFRLRRPCADFAEMVAMPVFAPARRDLVAAGHYDQRPASDGPYRVAAVDSRRLVLERNPYWRGDSDPVRTAWPDRFVVRFGVDPVASTSRLIADTGTARDSIQLDFNVPANYVQQVINDPGLAGRTVSGPTGAVRYLAINTRTVPTLRCRRALEYALDREAYRRAVGGPFSGQYATSMLPPGLPGHRRTDRYRGLAEPEGSVTTASRLTQQAPGCRSELTLDYQNVRSYRRAARSIVDSYQRIGVHVILHPIAKSRFYNVLGDPRREGDLVLAAWVPDWPSGSAILPALFDGAGLGVHAHAGNYNFSLLDNARVDDLIRRAQTAHDRSAEASQWAGVDTAVVNLAASVPILYEKGLAMHGGHVRGGAMQSLYGQPDVLALGLSRH